MLHINYVHQELQRICEIVRKEMANKSMSGEEIEWNSRMETLLLYSLFNLKPVGVNRFFSMVGIHNKFTNSINKEVPSQAIWDHLESMYDMSALHDSEMIPFPNDEKDFELPEEYNDIIKEQLGATVENVPNENEVLKNGSNNKTVKKSNVSKLKQSSASTNAKNTFAVPIPVKSSKSHSDSQPPSAEKTVKVKQETSAPTKASKVKRSSSPFTAGKNVKSEPQVKEEPVDVPVPKKTNKVENNNISSAKKTPKSEPSSSGTKKSTKQEPNANSARQGKSEAPDTSSKKMKNEKELSKKGRVSTSSENLASKKGSKSDNKKTEPDNKKSNDTSSSKPKTDKSSNTSGKGTKTEENETPAPSGSRKSVVKPDPIDKKRKRQKLEDSAKKVAPPTKRRRA